MRTEQITCDGCGLSMTGLTENKADMLTLSCSLSFGRNFMGDAPLESERCTIDLCQACAETIKIVEKRTNYEPDEDNVRHLIRNVRQELLKKLFSGRSK